MEFIVKLSPVCCLISLALLVGCTQEPDHETESKRVYPAPISLLRFRENERNRHVAKKALWSLKIPDTKDVLLLEPENIPAYVLELERCDRHTRLQQLDSLTGGILREISALKQMKGMRVAKPGFIVAGHGEQALRNAHDVFVHGNTPMSVYPPGVKVSIVFFSYLVSELDIVDVCYTDLDVRVQYQFMPFRKGTIIASRTSPSLVFIPLTTPTRLGHVNIEFQRIESADAGEESRLQPTARSVCKSFSFVVDRISFFPGGRFR